MKKIKKPGTEGTENFFDFLRDSICVDGDPDFDPIEPVENAVNKAVDVAKYVKKKVHDEPVEKAQKKGFEQGERKGSIETAKKFAARLVADDNLKIGVFALAVYVANKDFIISEEEKTTIEKYLGRPDSVINKTVSDELKNICENVPNFQEIRDKYLDEFSNDDLENINLFIMDVINADSIVSAEEDMFLREEWNPYLEQRGISI